MENQSRFPFLSFLCRFNFLETKPNPLFVSHVISQTPKMENIKPQFSLSLTRSPSSLSRCYTTTTISLSPTCLVGAPFVVVGVMMLLARVLLLTNATHAARPVAPPVFCGLASLAVGAFCPRYSEIVFFVYPLFVPAPQSRGNSSLLISVSSIFEFTNPIPKRKYNPC